MVTRRPSPKMRSTVSNSKHFYHDRVSEIDPQIVTNRDCISFSFLLSLPRFRNARQLGTCTTLVQAEFWGRPYPQTPAGFSGKIYPGDQVLLWMITLDALYQTNFITKKWYGTPWGFTCYCDSVAFVISIGTTVVAEDYTSLTYIVYYPYVIVRNWQVSY